MIQQVSNYSLSVSARTLTLTDFAAVDQARIVSIYDVTAGVMLYNNIDSVGVVTIATNVVTFSNTVNLAGVANGDDLQIVYDLAAGDPNYEDTAVSYKYKHVAAGQATTVIKATRGVLRSIIFNGPATASNVTTIYDNATGSGTVIGVPLTTGFTLPTKIDYNVAFANGLTIITATANSADMTFVYE